MTDLPWPIDEGSTHWDGCYRERRHHNCAVTEVDRLRAENARLRDIAESAAGECEYPTDPCDRDGDPDGMCLSCAATVALEADDGE